jgi:ElaB/YqjD/DUF883 family membrane-anchored ribosome-binding protein
MNESGNRGMGQPEQPRRQQGAGVVVETVKDKVRDAASGAAELAGQARDKVRDWAGAAAGAAENAWEGTREGASRAYHAVAETAENAWDGFSNLIRRNPVPSVLIALGVGFLCGSLLGAGGGRRFMERRY